MRSSSRWQPARWSLLHRDQGRWAEAEALLQRALEIEEAVFGLDHPGLAISLTTFGSLCRDLGRHAEAESHLRRALALEERALGPDDPRLAWSLEALGRVCQQQQRYAQAEALYVRALELRSARLLRLPAARNGGELAVHLMRRVEAAGRGEAPVEVGVGQHSYPAGGHPDRIVGRMSKAGHAMLDALVQTADARSSRGTITFWQPAGQSCVRSGGWACGGRARTRDGSG